MAGIATSRVSTHSPAKSGMTAEEYYALPHDHPRCELIDGELRMAPSPSFEHQDCEFLLAFLLETWLRGQGKGQGKVMVSPLDIEINPRMVLQPDILVLPLDHPQVMSRTGIVRQAPLLVVEFVSRDSVESDRKTKFKAYQSKGIPHYWIADTRSRSIEAWSLIDGAYDLVSEATAPATFSAPPFPDLVISLDEVFPLPPAK